MESNVAAANVEEVNAHRSSLVFPLRLYRFLHEAEEYHLSHIASFQADGRSFRIHNRIEFASATLRWFSFSKYESFQRQLNIYGFKRVLRGTDKGCYYHKKFIQGQYLLAQSIKRIPVRKTCFPIVHTPVADIRGMTTGASARESQIITSSDSQHISSDTINGQTRDIHNQQLTTLANIAFQSNLLPVEGTTPHRSSDQYVDAKTIINQYLRDTITNSISTLWASTMPPNTGGANAPSSYDIDVATLLVLQRLQNTSAVTHSHIPVSSPTSTLSSLSLQQTLMLSQSLDDLVNALTNHARLQSRELTSRARLQMPSQMDLSTLLFHFLGAHNARGQNQLHVSQSDTSSGSRPIHPTSSANVMAVQDILQQQNEMNRRLPDEQTIRNAIMLLQQQLPPNASATENA